MRIKLLTLTLSIMFLTSMVKAQVHGNDTKTTLHKTDPAKSSAQLESDEQELKRFVSQIQVYEHAYQKKDKLELEQISKQLINYMETQVSKTQQKIATGREELMNHTREVVPERKETHKNEANVEAPGDVNDREKDLDDEIKDKQKEEQERRDKLERLTNKENSLRRQKDILQNFRTLAVNFEEEAFKNDNRAVMLLNEFVRTREVDILDAKREMEEEEQKVREAEREATRENIHWELEKTDSQQK